MFVRLSVFVQYSNPLCFLIVSVLTEEESAAIRMKFPTKIPVSNNLILILVILPLTQSVHHPTHTDNRRAVQQGNRSTPSG